MVTGFGRLLFHRSIQSPPDLSSGDDQRALVLPSERTAQRSAWRSTGRRGVGGDYAPIEGGVLVLLADGARYRPARIDRQGTGWRRTDLVGEHVSNLDELVASADGSWIAYEYSTSNVPEQWYGAALDGAQVEQVQKLTRLNPSFAAKTTGRTDVIRWEGALGEEVEGLLHFPLDWEEGRRYPLILDIHGGPTGVDRDTWDSDWHDPNILWRQRGAFVLQVNYHGSSNYGLDWVESIGEGKYYDLEVPDIEAGVDEVIRRGFVDPDRLASSGWSNGGILTAALITESRRYRAAIVGAADVEWFSDWANVDFGAAFDNYYFGGTPWEKPEVYLEKSPFFRLHEVTTPTLVHTGTADRNVPPHQSWSLFRVLQQVGKAPTKLLLYPGEPHSLQKVGPSATQDRGGCRVARSVSVRQGRLTTAVRSRKSHCWPVFSRRPGRPGYRTRMAWRRRAS